MPICAALGKAGSISSDWVKNENQVNETIVDETYQRAPHADARSLPAAEGVPAALAASLPPSWRPSSRWLRWRSEARRFLGKGIRARDESSPDQAATIY